MTSSSWSTPSRRAVIVLGAMFVLLELACFNGIAPAPHTALRASAINGYLGLSLGTPFLFYVAALVSASPRVTLTRAATELAGVLALAALLEGPTVMAPPNGVSRWPFVCAGLGLASLVAVAAKAVLSRGAARKSALDLLTAASVLPVFVVLTRTGLRLTSALHPTTYDVAAFHIDALLGGQLSFAAGRLLTRVDPLRDLCLVVYEYLPVALGLFYAIELRAKRALPTDLLDATLCAGIVGFVLYHACPVAGPLYLFGERFPFDETSFSSIDASLGPTLLDRRVPRNGVPSLHTAWALLLYWHARPHGRQARAFAGGWLALTLLATLGLGEHYVIDLVIGVPVAVAVEAACAFDLPLARGPRPRALVTGAVLTVLGLLVVRTAETRALDAPAAMWALVSVTVLAPLLAHRGLEHGTAASDPR